MPGFLHQFSQFFRFGPLRSSSPQPSLSRPLNDAGVSSSPSPTTSPALYPPPLSEQVAYAATTTSPRSDSEHPTAPENPADRLSVDKAVNLFVDEAVDSFNDQPSWASSQVTPDAEQPAHFVSSSSPTTAVQAQNKIEPRPVTCTLTMAQQQPLSSEPVNPSSRPDLSQPQVQNQGMFNQAHNVSAMGNFVYGNQGNIAITNNSPSTSQFMEKLLKETIPGAASDSSARDPPPRCHPETRLAILGRCIAFIHNCNGVKKMRWVVGAAGVGKSAVMQNITESPELAVNYHASVFFSINGRQDGTKAVTTLCYQFAAKSDTYREIIEPEIVRDPSLLQASMAKQFNKLIVEPFVRYPQLNSAGRVLVIIDGLDECANPRTQQDLLHLIFDLCINHPSSPLVWLIASRPELHITSFFSRRNVIPAFEKEEIPVNSDEARADVERFLRDQLMEIKEASDSLDPHWPEERHIWKVADAAGGLFAYAQTVIRYVGDWRVGSPVSQLSDVLDVIDEHPMTHLSREEHPMALLDALYARILLNVSPKMIAITRKLLLASAAGWDWAPVHGSRPNFVVLCNWLSITPDEAYAALNHLRSVFDIPRRDQAHNEALKPFHKSFIDFISDFTRSSLFSDMRDEARQLVTQCALRILNEGVDGIDFGDVDYMFDYGILLRSPGIGDKISLTWHAEDGAAWVDNDTRLMIYKLAIGVVVAGIERQDPTFLSEFYIRPVTARFEHYLIHFPRDQFRELVFDDSRRREFLARGTLKQIPLQVVNNLNPYAVVELRFRRPAVVRAQSPDPWIPSCRHEWRGKWEKGVDEDWITRFDGHGCAWCFKRLERQLKSLEAHSPDQTYLVLFTSTGQCCVEVRFVDLEDGVSEWTYRFWCEIPLEVRRKYGSVV